MKTENPEEAIDEFLGLPAMEEEKGDWLVLHTSLAENVGTDRHCQGGSRA